MILALKSQISDLESRLAEGARALRYMPHFIDCPKGNLTLEVDDSESEAFCFHCRYVARRARLHQRLARLRTNLRTARRTP